MLETAKLDIFDQIPDLDIFDTLEEARFKPYVAPPRVEVKLTDEIRALIAEQVAAGVAQAMKGMKPTIETKVVEKTINNPTKVIVKELVDNSAEIIKAYEKKIKAAIDDYDKNRSGPIIIPNQRSNDAYRPSNVTPSRNYDATLTSLDEIANVLGSLIQSLQNAGVIK